MYRAIVELGKINNGMKLKFGLIIKEDSKPNMKFQPKIVEKFSLNGGDYLKINPHPYVVVDISGSSDKGEAWSSNKSVNLSEYGIYLLMSALRQALKNIQLPDMFQYIHNHLILNKQLAQKNMVVCPVSNKRILIQPIVVFDEQNAEIEYEGFSFTINSIDNFCTLTVEEAEFLIYKLSKINMVDMSLKVIQTVASMSKTEPRKIELDAKPVDEIKEQEMTITNIGQIKPPTEIPDLGEEE